MDDVRKNGVKNGELTQFSSANQPSSSAKKDGWARKKQAQAFMDKVMEYQDLTLDEFKELGKKLKNKGRQATIKEILAYQYTSRLITSDKFLLDWIDRHVGKASDIKSGIEDYQRIDKVIIQIIDQQGNEISVSK